jgi:beta-mannan synthase
MEAFQEVSGGVVMQIEFVWSHIREALVIPILKVAVFLCLCMLCMDFIEKVYMTIVICFVKLCGKKPEKRYKWESIKDDVELGNSNYPMVLVQIPMYNEREVNVKCCLFFNFNILQLLSTTFSLNAGLSAINWCCMWTLMAF